MANTFSLSVECGNRKESAEKLARHFQGFVVVLPDGSRFPCSAGSCQYPGGGDGWWTIVSPRDADGGFCDWQDENLITEIGHVLYERLRSAPPFRYATVGVECEEFRDFAELDDDVVKLDFNGLVLSDAVWEHLNSPEVFVPFAPGFRWRPFLRAR